MLEDIYNKVYSILEESCNTCNSNIIALSGGLDSSIIGHFLRDREDIKAVSVISEDFVSTDLTYCQMIAKEIGMPLSIYSVKTSEILEAIEDTIKILKNFNDMKFATML